MQAPLSRCFLVLLVGASVVPVSSCTTTSQDSAQSQSTLPVSKNWRQLAADKPLYYPVDYVPKGEMEYHEGEWVYAGGASFYIPRDGTPTASRDQLTAEALNLRKQYGGRPSAPAGRQQAPGTPSCEGFLTVLAGAVWLTYGPFHTILGGDGPVEFTEEWEDRNTPSPE